MHNSETIISPDTKRKERLPPGQYKDSRMPVLHYRSVPDFDPKEWRFRIWGEVEEERELTYKRFISLPQVKVFSDIHCVTTWSKFNITWEGVASTTLEELVRIKPGARFVLIHSGDGYSTNLSLDDFFQEDVVFALKQDGEPITPKHGAPVRLVVPRLYFWKSAKWATGVEFLKKDKKGYWEARGYHNRGDPWSEERYS
jgi:DMSO/TMAO reductase YedYZ molybdopterin-dependent catalytic subunit